MVYHAGMVTSRRRFRSPPALLSPPGDALSAQHLNDAFARVCKNRRNFPDNADIWHLRFHRATLLPQMLSAVNRGIWRLAPLTIVRRADGSACAVWSAQDAVVLAALTYALTPLLPVSDRCEHVRGHGGGKQSVTRIHHLVRAGQYRFVCRTDIRGYYAAIRRDLLMTQLRRHVHHPVHLDLLAQFLAYSVEDGGEFHTPKMGISRACALSPLLAAFHLVEVDTHFARQPQLHYVRYMDDFLIFARTRWHLRRAVRELMAFFDRYGFTRHPAKTFTGRVSKGTDWMGFAFNATGCTTVAPRAVSNMVKTLRRLYEQARPQGATAQWARVAGYLGRWLRWSALPLVWATGLQSCCAHRSSDPALGCGWSGGLPPVVSLRLGLGSPAHKPGGSCLY